MEQLLRNPRQARLPEKLIRGRSIKNMKENTSIIVVFTMVIVGHILAVYGIALLFSEPELTQPLIRSNHELFIKSLLQEAEKVVGEDVIVSECNCK